VSACGGSDKPASSTTSQTTMSPSDVGGKSTASHPVSDDPQVIAGQLKAAIPQIGEIVKITEDNDENNLIGRPGQYDAATFMEDKRLGCSADDNFNGLSIDCGAKLERWPSEADAQARSDTYNGS
jgi:hypothetical protein